MGSYAKTLHALYGAYRLARFDASGMQQFEDSPASFWHSFQAAIWVFPLYLLTVIARWNHMNGDISGWYFMLVELIAYVIAWTAYPVILPYVARAFNCQANYQRSIIAYNWTAILQNLVYSPLVIISLVGATGAGLLTLLVFIAIIAYSWFVTRTSLDISSAAAWAVVGIDILISMILSNWIDMLLQAN
jgi:hypothetical protein